MIRVAAFLAFGLAVCACAAGPVQTPRAAPFPGEVIGIELWETSWGFTTERWRIDASGAAVLEHRDRGVPLQQPLAPQAFNLTTADFHRIEAALQGAARFAGRNFTCSDGVTDAPSGGLIWRLADGSAHEIRWYLGCLGSNDDRDFVFARTSEADTLFHQIAGAR